jgi:hypothetical protein
VHEALSATKNVECLWPGECSVVVLVKRSSSPTGLEFNSQNIPRQLLRKIPHQSAASFLKLAGQQKH